MTHLIHQCLGALSDLPCLAMSILATLYLFKNILRTNWLPKSDLSDIPLKHRCTSCSSPSCGNYVFWGAKHSWFGKWHLWEWVLFFVFKHSMLASYFLWSGVFWDYILYHRLIHSKVFFSSFPIVYQLNKDTNKSKQRPNFVFVVALKRAVWNILTKGYFKIFFLEFSWEVFFCYIHVVCHHIYVAFEFIEGL